jgi:pimeloyl-ACP methyl ester carboxylesterase
MASLPLCDLHYIETGTGPPLIMIPATMSVVNDWAGLAAFMGQRFRVVFFELPGHGRSTPLEHFSSRQVAEVVDDFMDHLGFGQATLLGFSFGGILALTALERLSHRIDKVVLISPLVDSSALLLPPLVKSFLRAFVRMGQNRRLQEAIYRSTQSDRGSAFWAHLAARLGSIEYPDIVAKNLRATSLSTIQALAGQLDEILNTHRFIGAARYTQPCLFAMSVIDPLIDFSFTSAAVEKLFSCVDEIRLNLPYHRPRELPSLDYLNRTYPDLLDRMR